MTARPSEPAAPPATPVSRRAFGAALAGAASLAACGRAAAQEAGAPPAGATEAAEAADAPLPPDGLTEESLGEMLAALGLKPVREQSRFDFQFKTTLDGEQWDFTMSAVLSRNGQSLWVMAWLDELPKSAAAVPRAALLKMLAANDRMGTGKFFAFIPSNRRFVLQRVVPNTAMSNKKVRGLLIDLGRSVRAEYAVWSTEGWARKAPEQQIARDQPERTAAGEGGRTSKRPTRISTNDPKFNNPTRN